MKYASNMPQGFSGKVVWKSEIIWPWNKRQRSSTNHEIYIFNVLDWYSKFAKYDTSAFNNFRKNDLSIFFLILIYREGYLFFPQKSWRSYYDHYLNTSRKSWVINDLYQVSFFPLSWFWRGRFSNHFSPIWALQPSCSKDQIHLNILSFFWPRMLNIKCGNHWPSGFKEKLFENDDDWWTVTDEGQWTLSIL